MDASMTEDKLGRIKVNEICFPRMDTLTRCSLSQSNSSLWIWGKCYASMKLYAYSYRIVFGMLGRDDRLGRKGVSVLYTHFELGRLSSFDE